MVDKLKVPQLRAIASPDRSTAIKARESWHVLGIISEFIEATEALTEFAEGPEHPQGAKTFNGKIHQCFGHQNISKLEGGRLNVVHRTSIEDGLYEVEADWESAVTEAVDTFVQIDVLVNNAGVLLFSELTKTSLEEYERVIRINQVGYVPGRPMRATSQLRCSTRAASTSTGWPEAGSWCARPGTARRCRPSTSPTRTTRWPG